MRTRRRRDVDLSSEDMTNHMDREGGHSTLHVDIIMPSGGGQYRQFTQC